MKKIKTFALASLAILPALALCACGEPQFYSITTFSSSELLGTASGGSAKEVQEGSKLTLTASAKPSANSSFLCWVHNSNKIVSRTSQLEVTASSQTNGIYTALFEGRYSSDNESINYSQIMYAMATNLEYQVENVSSVSYSIEYASLTASDNFHALTSGSYDQSINNSIVGSDVFYLGKPGNLFSYSFKVIISEVSYTNSEMVSNIGEVKMNGVISSTSFDSNGEIVLKGQDDRGNGLALTLSKLSSKLWERDI
jgi:hypothetical protein